jgi:hypothetical protein
MVGYASPPTTMDVTHLQNTKIDFGSHRGRGIFLAKKSISEYIGQCKMAQIDHELHLLRCT